ncbi:UNVERIFIED_CONTAM: hypothetical protein GTU68_062500 [Idotea baltica]|nr:hypothetical protein [Idotea baltica]MCL4129635.1 hypothetical protein [Idotea baltica]
MIIFQHALKHNIALVSLKKTYQQSISKLTYPVLFYFTAHIASYCSGEVLSGNNKRFKAHRFEEKTCKKDSFIYFDKHFYSSHSLNQMTELDNRYPNLKKIGVLNNENILIKDKDHVENVVSLLLQDGFNNLQLVVDFDYTLTRGHFKNEKALCSWGILDNSLQMPPFYREKSQELLNKYYPIEIDPDKSEAEKIPSMVEWYSKISELLKECNVNKKDLREMVAQSNVKFREDTDKLFAKLRDEDVPMLIFSAGMGDVLEHVLWHFDVYSPNVKVVSNFFKYNEEGVMVGFLGALIHMFNKNENSIHSSDYFGDLRSRSNVLLLGDSLGDVKMAVGVPPGSNVLKIGFLNHSNVTERVRAYESAFDIVLVNDQSMAVPNSILALIKS